MEMPALDVNWPVAPCARHPGVARRSIRPIARHPDIIHARAGRNRLNYSHRRGHDWRCANHRCRDDDRQWQPDGEAEADSGVGRHCNRTDQRGHEEHFSFHSFIQGVIALPQTRRTSNCLVTSFMKWGQAHLPAWRGGLFEKSAGRVLNRGEVTASQASG